MALREVLQIFIHTLLDNMYIFRFYILKNIIKNKDFRFLVKLCEISLDFYRVKSKPLFTGEAQFSPHRSKFHFNIVVFLSKVKIRVQVFLRKFRGLQEAR